MNNEPSTKKRPYEPPTLEKVDLVKLGKGSRMMAATPGYILAQAPVSGSNVTGGILFGPSSRGNPPPQVRKR